MPPTGNQLPQASRPSMPPTSRPPPRGSFQNGTDAPSTTRDSTNAPSNSPRSVRRQSTEHGSLRLGPSPPIPEASQRGIASHSMTNLDETYLLDPLNGIPHPPSLIPDPTMEEYAGEAEMNRQQRKRKRLASEDVSAHQFAPYGHKGQVVPGPLKLEVVDVNTHESNTCKDTLYQANILRRNWSVYATQTDHCDVILEHKAQVPFSLTKLVIKVPIATTYRQPIGEGLLFVAMTASDFSRTVHYRLRSTTPSADPTHGRGTYFHFHDRPPSRRADNGINPAANGWQQLGAHWVRPAGRIHHRSSADPYSPQRVLSPPIPDSAFQVRAARDDPSSESEYASGDDSDASTISSHHTPERRSRARSDTPRPTSSPTPPAEFLDDEQQPDASMVALVRQRMRGPIDQGVTDPGAYVSSNSRRRRLNKERDSMGSTDAKSEMDKDGQDSGILRPQARFFFGKGKTRVSVKLDPPVSGKLILLKLWSKSEDQTIDIQNIAAYGYVGQRYFPSVQAQ